MAANILTECYVDTLLAEVAAPPAKGYNHQHSCNKVLGTMKAKLANEFAIGIIDDDKIVPKDFENFDKIKEHGNALALYKHKTQPHYVIKVIPASEQFILNAAQQCNVSPTDYNLPVELKKMLEITKHKTVKDSADVKNLLVAIKQNNAESFCKLAQWIEHLKENPYAPQLDLL
jgi:hypothetical protein